MVITLDEPSFLRHHIAVANSNHTLRTEEQAKSTEPARLQPAGSVEVNGTGLEVRRARAVSGTDSVISAEIVVKPALSWCPEMSKQHVTLQPRPAAPPAAS